MSNIALIVTDDLAIDQQDTDPVSISLGSGSVITPTIVVFTQSGSNNHGFVARIQTPQSYSSGALLETVRLQCGAKTTAQSASIGIAKLDKAGASGSRVLFRNVVLAAGSSFFSGSGARVVDGDYLAIVTHSGASANSAGDCVAKATWSELYTSSH